MGAKRETTLPEANLRAAQRILDREARRLLDERLAAEPQARRQRNG